jgi:SPP1 family predicted phage head-tail adaptor
MDIGKLNKRITIEQPSTAQDAAGGLSPTWSTFAQVWGAVEPLAGYKLFAAQQADAGVTGTVRIRYLAGVLPNMRVNYNGRYLYIKSIINTNERNEELQLLYSESYD